MANLEPLMRRNFLEYASYSILDRAIPDLRDGCKPVQRRILQTLFEMNDGGFHKVANVIGESMKLHPHGDASIGDALVVLANKEYFIERQGNFGNLLTGHAAAAARYIECRLTPLALETLFNRNLTEMQPSYDGRKQEPVFLPAKLPVVLLLGIEGIAVGMATRILPHCFTEVLRAQIAILQDKRFRLLPDFPQGGVMDASEYDQGLGRVKVRARIEPRGDKKVVVTELPFGVTTESLIASIEAATQKGRVKVTGIDDFTTDHVEIELQLARGVYAEEVIPQLYAYTECEVSIVSSPLVIQGDHPVELPVPEMLKILTERLRAQLKAELEWDMERLQDRQHWLTLEQVFIEQKVYKKLETARTEEKVREAVWDGMAPHRKLFVRDMTEDDVKRLLDIRIRRISAFDVEKSRQEIDGIETDIRGVRGKLRDMKRTSIAYLEDLIARYGELYPRRTKVTSIEEVDKKAVANQNLRLSYDPETSYFGIDVRGSEFQMNVTEYERILAISSDGTYRIMAPPRREFLPKAVLYCAPFDAETGVKLTVVYRDAERMAFAKKIWIQRFVTGKEYRLVKDAEGRVDLLLPAGERHGRLELHFAPRKGQRVKEATFDLASLEESSSPSARGTRLAAKPVARVKLRPPGR